LTHDEAKSAAERIARNRQRARTDLAYLAGIVLCYGSRKAIPGMVRVYQPVFDSLQKFQGGTDFYKVNDNGTIHHEGYKPLCPLWELKGIRNTLLLFPRNHLKTTLSTVAHSIQWIINYPDVRIKLVAAQNGQVEGFLREIKEHFISNPNFRQLFPEYCPKIAKSGKMEDFGNNEFFTIPNRTVKTIKEPTVSILSEGSVMSSTHYEVVKPDDLVDHENSKTAERVAGVNAFFDQVQPLVERSPFNPDERGWLDVAGTRYNFSDTYGRIIQKEQEAVIKTWNIVVKSAIYEENGERKALWPERMSLAALDAERASTSSFAFSSQYLQSPISEGQGLVSAEADVIFHQRTNLDAIRPFLREYVCVDMASLEDVKHSRSDYSAIIHGGWDRDGRLHMIDVRHGRMNESQFLDNIFDLARKNPQILYFKFQKDLISSTFMPVMQREMSVRGEFFETDWVSVSGRNKIQDRIQHLEPLYRNKQILFYDPVSPSLNDEGNRLLKMRILDEILKFPYYAHDDFLDAQSDFLMHRNEEGTDQMPERWSADDTREPRPFGHNTLEPKVYINTTLHDRIFGKSEDSMTYPKSSVTGF
jgi:phage terminase large subunit-like protein